MVAKAEDLVVNLKSSDPGTRLKAVRDVKNQVIGNKQRKKAFIKLGAIPHIVQVLKDEPESSLLVQCATVVGSLARVDAQCVQDLAHSGAVAPLFQMIASKEECVVDAGLRALNFIFEVYQRPVVRCDTATLLSRCKVFMDVLHSCRFWTQLFASLLV